MRRIAAFLITAALLAACGDDVLQSTTLPPATTAPTTTEAPTTTTTAAPTTTTTLPWGPAAADCVNGWITPEPGSGLWNDGLSYIGVGPLGVVVPAEDFTVDEMRYFVGPEDADMISPRREVERWYIKGFSTTDPAFRSRWLARRVEVGAGVAWAADYTSTGWAAGTWITCYDPERDGIPYATFCIPGAAYDPFPDPCFGFAPGAWSPGDCSGLPPEVLGCVAGT